MMLPALQLSPLASSWVFEDPRRCHLFLYLLSKADEKGWAEFSVRGYAKQFELDYSSVRRAFLQLEENGIVESIVNQKRTIVFICEYERYIASGQGRRIKSESITNQSAPPQKEQKEKTLSPQTPYIEEKEKKENAKREVASLQEEEEEPQAENLSSLSATPSEVGCKHYLLQGTLDERRNRFWADCVHCAARHPEWPREAVQSFFRFWTQQVPDGRFAFEAEAKWGISHQMSRWVNHREEMENLREARLQRVRGGKAVSRERAEYMARNRELYEKARAEEHDRMELARQQARQNAITPEEMRRYVEAGLLRPDGLTPQGLRPNPLTLKQQYLMKISNLK